MNNIENFIEKIGLKLYPCYGTMGGGNNISNWVRNIYLNQWLIVVNLSIDYHIGDQNRYDSFTQKYLRGEYNHFID